MTLCEHIYKTATHHRALYPKVQIFTAEDYFAGKRPDLPDVSYTLKKAKRITKPQTKPELGL